MPICIIKNQFESEACCRHLTGPLFTNKTQQCTAVPSSTEVQGNESHDVTVSHMSTMVCSGGDSVFVKGAMVQKCTGTPSASYPTWSMLMLKKSYECLYCLLIPG